MPIEIKELKITASFSENNKSDISTSTGDVHKMKKEILAECVELVLELSLIHI